MTALIELSERMLEALRWLESGPSTVDEFVTDRDYYVNSWAPAFTALRKAGLIKRTGRKLPTSHGGEAFELAITPDGRYFLENR